MIEIFLVTMCLGSHMNEAACSKAWDTYHNNNKEMLLAERNFNKYYVDPLPEEVKFFGGSAYTIYRKELMFPIVSGFIIDVRDKGEGGLVWRKDFP